MAARNRVALSAAMALCLVMLQFGAIRLSPSALPVRIIVPATIAAAPVALWHYRRRIGVWVMFVGLGANLCVIIANGGLMPMERPTLVSAIGYERADAYTTGGWIAGSKDVLVERPSGRFVALGDGVVVHVGANGFVASPGDIVIWSGLLILAAEASIAWQLARRRARAAWRDQIARAQAALPDGVGQAPAEGSSATQR